MVKVIQDNKLLIDFFHESLSSETLSLYISQDKSKMEKKKSERIRLVQSYISTSSI